MPRWQWLPYYATLFDTVELNVTYYRLPSIKMAKGWVDRTPDGFSFTVKAHRSLTHERKELDFNAFLESVAPLIDAGKLACILAQFPHSFHPSPANFDHLQRVREGFVDLPVVIEFRDSAWVNEGTFEFLKGQDLGFCCVDEPPLRGLMPPETRVTGPLGYVRFHGRNAEKWWRHEHAWERYDYSYTEGELEEWLPRLQALDSAAPLTLVYANNHYRGQSVDTLKKLERILAGDR
jgi:uncharacterized protein YecE (DUF72 family)